MRFFRRTPFIPVLRLSGPIGMATPLRPGLSLATTAEALERAFTASKLGGVGVIINSPGGSPVQSHLIFQRIRQLAGEHKKRVHVFCEDVAASGGYFLAVAGDEIYADPSSIVGSIGVITSSFGLEKAIEKLGIERRVYTAGLNKGGLDPFLPEKSDDVERLKQVQRDIHDVFIGIVKDRRGRKLAGPDTELFSGAYWSAARALEFGLIDGIADPRGKLREIYGPKVQLRVIPTAKPGLLSRFRRLPGIPLGATLGGDGLPGVPTFAQDALSTLEVRALWARYGL